MKDELSEIFVFGASGHGKVVTDIIEKEGRYRVRFFVDDDPSLKGSDFFGYTVIGGKKELLEARHLVTAGIVAIGSNNARAAVAGWLANNGFSLVSAVHPSAQVARGVSIAGGTVVMAGAVINSDSRIGCNVIVNTKASVDHDCSVGDGVHLAPGSTLCGTVSIGARTFICAGATVIPNLNVGERAVVGAGATVIRHVNSHEMVAGNPARLIKHLEET